MGFYIYPSFCPFSCYVGYTTSQKFDIIKIFECFWKKSLMLTEAAFYLIKMQ